MKLFSKERVDRVKAFNYKSLDAYKKLFKDPKFRKGLLVVVVFFIAVTFLKSCIFKPKPKPVMPRPVQTALVIKKDVPIFLESFGTLAALEDVNIQAQVTGKIKEVHFKEGDEVSAGDLLFTIDPSEYNAQLKKAEASLAQDVADLGLKIDTLDRNKLLIEKDLISKQDFESFQTEVAAGIAAVDLDRANVELAKIDVGYCYIKSPVDGLAGRRQVDPGNIVTANSGPILVNIKSINPLYIDFTISERVLSDVQAAKSKGVLKVIVMPEGIIDKKIEGELLFLDNAVDNMTGTILLRGVISNKQKDLRAGQFVTVRLILEIARGATLAPYGGVSVGQKGHYLFVATDDNKADLRQLTVGMREGDYIIIKKGVKPGEKIVTDGQLGLAPGVSIVDIKRANGLFSSKFNWISCLAFSNKSLSNSI